MEIYIPRNVWWTKGEGKLADYTIAHAGIAGPLSHFAKHNRDSLRKEYLNWSENMQRGAIKDQPDYEPKCWCYGKTE